uniref:Ig-like domain-containing protein n=1 Tax=Labrus bergylta TaxID=56723 RepID=A0A3Q3DZ94_9LABR
PSLMSCSILTCPLFSTTSKSSFLHFQTVSVGESVTLPCACQDETAVMFYCIMIIVTFHDKFKNNPRFSFDPKISKYALKILDFGISDSATYFCIGSDLYNFEFCQSTTVSTKDLDIQAIIHQSVSETTTKPGDMTLTCTVHPGTCDGEHNVYWFKNSEESHPGLIYTHGGRNDQCERNPTPQTHSCVYNLPMTNLNLSHAGTYYCAVASCGHILFGNGTKLDFHNDVDIILKKYFNLVFLVLNTILVVILTVLVSVIIKTKCDQCTGNMVNCWYYHCVFTLHRIYLLFFLFFRSWCRTFHSHHNHCRGIYCLDTKKYNYNITSMC